MEYLDIEAALAQIEEESPGFVDDGLSCFPDWMYRRWKLDKAGRRHDWRYCSRCHPAGTMNQANRSEADTDIRKHSQELLPQWLYLTPYIILAGVRMGGGQSAWNSCGPDSGERCRHNMAMPEWMKALG